MQLRAAGMSQRAIARERHMSRTSVVEVFQIAACRNLSYDMLEDKSAQEVYRIFFPDKHPEETVYTMPDYEYVHKELSRTGVTLKLLWKEYQDKCRIAGSLAFGYTKFCNTYTTFVDGQNLTNHLHHKPGIISEVDWSGPTMSLLDTTTGGTHPVYLFVATLPYSQYSYVEPCLDMKQNTWLKCHVNMFAFWGGVTARIVCDNLKTGVIRHPKEGEILLNESYEALGNHYMTAIIPAGVRKPKGKASVEGTVGKIATAIIAKLRNETFTTLPQVKLAVTNALAVFNETPFQKRDGSRLLVFEGSEKQFLSPLPSLPYEVATWQYKKVLYPDCHVVFAGNHYSCPYQYVGKKVDLRIGDTLLEVYYQGERIATHLQFPSHLTNQWATNKEDLPEQFQKTPWDKDRIILWVMEVGPSTKQVVDRIFQSYQLPERAYNPCLAVLRLSKKYDATRLETACSLAIQRFQTPRYRHLQAIIAAEEDVSFRADQLYLEQQQQEKTTGYVRGSGYYGGLNHDE
ncbi:MAG: IS21 family transposase [Rikenellaceae bacterium]